MKKIFIYLFVLATVFCLNSCSEDDLDSNSIFSTTTPERTEFEKWLIQNYTYPYNIEFKYQMEDTEAPMGYNLVPADLEKSKQMAKLVKFMWLETYDEIKGVTFTRKYVPKIIHLIGSAAWSSTNTKVVGSAEGGLKITLFEINELDVTDGDALNRDYFHTMHHEFAHILNQNKEYDPSFKEISNEDYVMGNWYQVRDTAAHRKGFITPYAMSEPNEDFVELISTYVTSTPAEWDAILKDADSTYATTKRKGSVNILKKFQIVRDYMKDSWEIDLDQLRDVVARRTSELYLLDLENL